ncbi:MAG: hypothetical protein LBD65_05280 [Spirochaetaceae bacterium]|jgi:Flp pilus assembly protein TadG|nr:hypothetical protein [Spirochaetaceae bacterium]
MKRFFCFIFLAAIAIALGFSQDLATYTYLYNGAETISDRLSILRQAEEANLGDSEEFFANALSRLLTEYPNIQITLERNAADATARFLAKVLGDKKYTAAGGNLWRLVEVFANPLVKADALIALGRVGAVNYVPQILQTLHDLNARPALDREGGERIAYGAIVALENYQDLPEASRKEAAVMVYLASTGWYSDRVKNQAKASLKNLAGDPAEPYVSVIRSSSYSYESKYQALQDLEAADASASVKAGVALDALAEGWRLPANDMRVWATVTNIRKLAIRMINRYHTEDEAVYPLLERSYRYGTDTQEKLDTVAALASLSTDKAVELLSSFLMIINGKLQSNNLRPDDQQMVRALIPAIGATGNPQGRLVINVVLSLNWNEAVKKLANDALTRL